MGTGGGALVRARKGRWRSRELSRAYTPGSSWYVWAKVVPEGRNCSMLESDQNVRTYLSYVLLRLRRQNTNIAIAIVAIGAHAKSSRRASGRSSGDTKTASNEQAMVTMTGPNETAAVTAKTSPTRRTGRKPPSIHCATTCTHHNTIIVGTRIIVLSYSCRGVELSKFVPDSGVKSFPSTFRSFSPAEGAL